MVSEFFMNGLTDADLTGRTPDDLRRLFCRVLWRVVSSVLGLFQLFYVFAAIAFSVASLLGTYPMSPEIYGLAVYTIPAMVWSGYLLAAHGMATLGLWLARPRLTLVGCSFAMLAYIAFAVLAIRAEYGDLVVIFSALVNGPISLSTGMLTAMMSGVVASLGEGHGRG